MPMLARLLTVFLLLGPVILPQPSSAQTLTPRNAFIHMMNGWSTRIAMLRVCNKPRRAQSARTLGVQYLMQVLGVDRGTAEQRMDKGINHFVGFFRRALASSDPPAPTIRKAAVYTAGLRRRFDPDGLRDRFPPGPPSPALAGGAERHAALAPFSSLTARRGRPMSRAA